MYMIMEHRLLKQKFKVKIRLRSNPTTTRFSFWNELIKRFGILELRNRVTKQRYAK